MEEAVAAEAELAAVLNESTPEVPEVFKLKKLKKMSPASGKKKGRRGSLRESQGSPEDRQR